ncbi:MAG: DNA cytosine methyltransferase [Chloroflexi bacterium]|nr:DNA cytosine methyltransferase [Chloroflexota bacterium]
MWREMFRAIRELRPRYVLIENVAALLTLARSPGEPAGSAWSEVLADLASLGFDVEWDCFPAAAFGAPHLRDRLIAVACRTDEWRSEWASTYQTGPTSATTRPSARNAERRSESTFTEWVPARAADGNGTQCGRSRPKGQSQRPESAALAAGADAERDGDQREGPDGWADAAGGSPSPAPDADRNGLRQQSEPERGRGGPSVAARAGEAAADPARTADGANARATRRGESRDGPQAGGPTSSCGVGAAWGEYEPAIRRWEAIQGPAPKPLIRRMDDRSTAGLDRSQRRTDRQRLSALGDGVLVQLGELAGRYIVGLEAARGSVQVRP